MAKPVVPTDLVNALFTAPTLGAAQLAAFHVVLALNPKFDDGTARTSVRPGDLVQVLMDDGVSDMKFGAYLDAIRAAYGAGPLTLNGWWDEIADGSTLAVSRKWGSIYDASTLPARSQRSTGSFTRR